MLRTPRGVFTLRHNTCVLMESNLECSSTTETSTDSGTLSAVSRIGRKLKQNRSTLWASGQSIIGKNKSIMCKTLMCSLVLGFPHTPVVCFVSAIHVHAGPIVTVWQVTIVWSTSLNVRPSLADG